MPPRRDIEQLVPPETQGLCDWRAINSPSPTLNRVHASNVLLAILFLPVRLSSCPLRCLLRRHVLRIQLLQSLHGLLVAVLVLLREGFVLFLLHRVHGLPQLTGFLSYLGVSFAHEAVLPWRWSRGFRDSKASRRMMPSSPCRQRGVGCIRAPDPRWLRPNWLESKDTHMHSYMYVCIQYERVLCVHIRVDRMCRYVYLGVYEDT